jgi:quercetin dioxygenase-like cupin family protein
MSLRRRSLFQTGFAATAAAFAFPGLLEGAEDDQAHVFAFDKIEPETYPWGWIRWIVNGQIDPHAEMTMGLVELGPNQSNPLHIHPNSAEYLHVLAGSCEHLVGDRWVALKAGDSVRIPKNVPHQARTKGEACRSLILYDTPKRVMIPVADGKTPEPAKP